MPVRIRQPRCSSVTAVVAALLLMCLYLSKPRANRVASRNPASGKGLVPNGDRTGKACRTETARQPGAGARCRCSGGTGQSRWDAGRPWQLIYL